MISGGTAALAACVGGEGGGGTERADVGGGVADGMLGPVGPDLACVSFSARLSLSKQSEKSI